MNGALAQNSQDFATVRDIVEVMPVEGLDNFGQDPGGPLPSDIEEVCSTVVVNCPPCPLNEAHFLMLLTPSRCAMIMEFLSTLLHDNLCMLTPHLDIFIH